MASTSYTPRFGYDIRIKPEGEPRPAPAARGCARADCAKEGTHKVPKSRENLGEHLWFCLEHAREHNENWDYFRGMSETEIEAFRVAAITGHRPTWKVDGRGRWHDTQMPPDAEYYSDPHGIFTGAAAPPRPAERRFTGVQLKAFEVLNLDAGASLREVKARYKELVKRFHPDANGGDRGAEERLKQVIKAYGVLRAAGLT